MFDTTKILILLLTVWLSGTISLNYRWVSSTIQILILLIYISQETIIEFMIHRLNRKKISSMIQIYVSISTMNPHI